ncbi:MAG: hypothetical protein WC530_09470 [Candidatus Omnitrophota bacterium]
MNTNPTLVIGLAMQSAGKSGAELKPGDQDQVELRVYPNNGAGYFFVIAKKPGRWYWKDEPRADHFRNIDQTELDDAIQVGARVQLTGYHGRSLVLWRTWAEFERSVKSV